MIYIYRFGKQRNMNDSEGNDSESVHHSQGLVVQVVQSRKASKVSDVAS